MKIFNKLLGIVFVLVTVCNSSFAVEPQNTATEDIVVELGVQKDNRRKVVVISDRVYPANQKYYIYPEVTEMIAQDLINELNKQGFLYSPSLTSVRERLKKSDIYPHANKLLNDYHYTYNINFGALNKVAAKLGADDILLITGGLDTTSDFLKPTWYSFLNIPGENSVKSEYRLETHLALIDVKNQVVIWEKDYTKRLTATEFALAGVNNSPEYRQLTKMKKSSASIAKDASYRVESALTPMLALKKAPPTVHEKLKFNINKKYDEHIQNVNVKRELKKQMTELSADELPIPEPSAVPAEMPTGLELKGVEVEQTIKSPIVLEKSELNAEPIVEPELKPVVVTPEVQQKTDELTPVYEIENEGEKHIQISPLNIIIPKM